MALFGDPIRRLCFSGVVWPADVLQLFFFLWFSCQPRNQAKQKGFAVDSSFHVSDDTSASQASQWGILPHTYVHDAAHATHGLRTIEKKHLQR